MSSFDIVIAHRGPEMGLWMTVSSCEIALCGSGYDYRYHIVENGGSGGSDLEMTLDRLEKTGKLGSIVRSEEPLSPPVARNIGARVGYRDLIFFLDNHVMVEKDYFNHAVNTMGFELCDALHSVTAYWPGEPLRYHYRLTLERNFWGYQLWEPALPNEPYRIAVGGHGGFVVRRSTWEEVGGYWEGFEGYGGEETYFDLKLALLDKTNWLDPRMVHWHHPGKRPYARDKSDDFLKNMMMAANIIGGEKWAQRVKSGLQIGERWATGTLAGSWNGCRVTPLYEAAIAKSSQHAAWLHTVQRRTLNQQLVLFQRQKVAQ